LLSRDEINCGKIANQNEAVRRELSPNAEVGDVLKIKKK